MKRRYGARVGSILLAAASVFALTLGAAPATAQVKPRIVIAFDTSGSMMLDMSEDELFTFGDGVTTGCTLSSNIYCGANCTAGMDTNCDGLVNDSRIYIAKEAVRNMVLAFGDVDWGLARFQQRTSENVTCQNIDNYECNIAASPSIYIGGMGNPSCNGGLNIPTGSCYGGADFESIYPAECRPGTSGIPGMRKYGTSMLSPRVCLNYSGLSPSGQCLDGGDVLVGFNGLDAFASIDNTYAIYKWVNNQESNFQTSPTSGNFCRHATSGDCELRPNGPTPLAGLLSSVSSYVATAQTSDTAAACRPYSVILLTDGAETCGGNPSAAAAALQTAGVLTYVVGMNISTTGRTQLNTIAASGGTDAGSAGGDNAYFADDPVSLAAGLSDIVGRSLLFETCNNADDDCDSTIDEGFSKYCNVPGGVPTSVLCTDPGETRCDGVDDNCNGVVDEGVQNECGTCGTAPLEVCDGVDNDCDGVIDEGSCTCVAATEICDGLDNDCDTLVDEGLTRSCGSDVGTCVAGVETCSAGDWVDCTGVGPEEETCDGEDNDCDGVTDGMSRSCGSDEGACQSGAQICTASVWGDCSGEVMGSAETCDGEDDDCDTRVDEGNPGGGGSCGSALGECETGLLECASGVLTCQGGVGPVDESCDDADNDCDGRTDESVPTRGACGTSTGECEDGVLACVDGDFACVGGRGPSTELCDGLDNDCNGIRDDGNPGGGRACGTSTGECATGISQCVGGILTCPDDIEPGVETCNNADDDCDGLVDEGNPGGGGSCGTTDEGECEFGALACVDGALSCIGGLGPSDELCDGLDNDCDGTTDEGNPEAGDLCGDDTGECSPGTTVCSGGALSCEGGVGPTDEICDGLDNDCDGVPDDGLPVGAACGTDVGECTPGLNICRGGEIVCEGAVDPIDEVCDGLDNDCDGEIDEGLPLGDACGSAEGLCEPGLNECLGGREICVGEVGAEPEICDCGDNDCDGSIDEEPKGSPFCPGESACRDCQCALPCVQTEFEALCPTGRSPKLFGEECYCVATLCDPVTCAGETIERKGEVACAPGTDDVSSCVCRNNACTFPCDGVVCADGLVCNPRSTSGACVADSCRTLGCDEGFRCNVDTDECEADPCEVASCESTQVCRDGVCEASCADVMCGTAESCSRGRCVSDRCAGVTCPSGLRCAATSGDCETDLCDGVACADGFACDPANGECTTDPCNSVRCPSAQVCVAGECYEMTDAGMPTVPDAGVPADGGPIPRTRIVATGGGGCSCDVGAVSSRSQTTGGMGLLLGLAFALRLLRRRLSRLAVWGLMPVAALLAGCDVNPYCLDCEDGGVRDARIRDAYVADRPLPMLNDSGPPDALVPDACSLREELCNEADDDCDGRIDESILFDTDTENCGSCGNVCSPAHAFGVCVSGECTLGTCDVGWLDINVTESDGCEYRCLPTADNDSVCDLRDNDCDFMTDEDVAFLTDPTNCGVCGRVCGFPHAAGACEAGECALGACADGYYNLNGVARDGCEYGCVPTGVETCNRRDDNCDGETDELDPGGGVTCGIALGECSTGVTHCRAGNVECVGAVVPTTEICNGLDDDCDGVVDQGNPEAGALCGSSTGTCQQGRLQCRDGDLVCDGAVTAVEETCDGLDNNCDGNIDEGDPESGAACGIEEGSCSTGTLHCRGGVLTCEGAVGPVMESCNGADDDCDGSTDEDNPGGGDSCGTDIGECSPGTYSCTGGLLVCSGAVTGSPEVCDGLDNDCDNVVDDGNPDGGGSCGVGTGECTAGTEQCLGGTVQCVGSTGASAEVCDSLDNDCDGTADETFAVATDVRNCGVCGHVCALDHAIENCSAGTCGIAACESGYYNIDGVVSNGCEYACSFNGTELCNGRDDDCDTRTDESLSAPSGLCNPNGVCTGTTPSCSGALGWLCNYPSTYESVEAACDELDNDCDGAVDEPFVLKGTDCFNGVGACRRDGEYLCSDDSTGVVCGAATAGAPASEACDNVDNDCDGLVDERQVDLVGTAYRDGVDANAISLVDLGAVRIMQYEASRPDATASSPGSAGGLACSKSNVVPWTNVTWDEASAACCALNVSGSCGPTGFRLCEAADWENACKGPLGTCTHSYSSSCAASNTTACNGEEYDCNTSSTGDQDCLFSTGSSTFPGCRTVWSGGSVYDLSGNVKEWTNTSRGSDLHELRGGGYSNIEAGRTCDFDYTVGDSEFAFPNTGFRCCFYE